jgi:hypothetical protein
MFWLKGCPRCHGDLHEIHDVGDTYVSCIQCGRILTETQEQALPRPRQQVAPRKTVAKAAA